MKFKGVEIEGWEKMTTEEKIEAKHQIIRQRRTAREDAADKELYDMVKEHAQEEDGDLGYRN